MNNNLKKNAKNIKEIQFVALESNAPLFTVTGPNVQFFLENSELVQNILELSKDRPNKHVLVVPIGFPADRRTLFTNILYGKPIGKRLYNNVEYYPLGEQEEQNIQAAVNQQLGERNGTFTNENRRDLIQKEREQVILNTMRYLLLPDELIAQMLILDEKKPEGEFTLDEEVENLVETHKKYLFLIGRQDLLSEKDRAELQEYFEAKRKYFALEKKRLGDLQQAYLDKYYKQMRSRALMRNRNNDYNEPPDRYEEELDALRDEEREVFDPSLHLPVGMKGYGTVTMLNPVEYERFLRTKYFRGRHNHRMAKGIPGELHLNTLFNENERAKKTRANEQNNSTAIFYNPNRPATKTRKNNKGKKGNNKKSKSNNNNGTAF